MLDRLTLAGLLLLVVSHPVVTPKAGDVVVPNDTIRVGAESPRLAIPQDIELAVEQVLSNGTVVLSLRVHVAPDQLQRLFRVKPQPFLRKSYIIHESTSQSQGAPSQSPDPQSRVVCRRTRMRDERAAEQPDAPDERAPSSEPPARG